MRLFIALIVVFFLAEKAMAEGGGATNMDDLISGIKAGKVASAVVYIARNGESPIDFSKETVKEAKSLTIMNFCMDHDTPLLLSILASAKIETIQHRADIRQVIDFRDNDGSLMHEFCIDELGDIWELDGQYWRGDRRIKDWVGKMRARLPKEDQERLNEWDPKPRASQK